jgi:hypothetical protein
LAVELADNDTDAEVAADAQEYSLAGLRRIVRQKRAISASEAAVHHRSRSLRWWWEDNSCLRLWGRLPADQGAVVIKAVARIADHAAPGPDGFYESYECRAADALADVCGARIGDDPDPDKSTVVVHVDAGLLAGGDGVAELEDGPFVAAEVGRRLACGARIQVVAHGGQRRDRRARADSPQPPSMASTAGKEEGPVLSVPRLHEDALPATPPHSPLGQGGADGQRQPRDAVLAAPLAGARGWLGDSGPGIGPHPLR